MEKIFYLAHVLGTLHNLACVLLAFAILAVICFVIWYISDELYEVTNYNEEESRVCKKWLKTSVVTLIISLLVAIFIPSSRAYLFMAGGDALEKIAKNERVQERASHTIDLLDQYLEKQVKKNDE